MIIKEEIKIIEEMIKEIVEEMIEEMTEEMTEEMIENTTTIEEINMIDEIKKIIKDMIKKNKIIKEQDKDNHKKK
jgi:hypothetical protein